MPDRSSAVPHPHDAVFRFYRYMPHLAARRCLVSFKRWAKQVHKHVADVPLMQVQECLARCFGYPDHHAWHTTMTRLQNPVSDKPDVVTMDANFVTMAALLVQLAPGAKANPDEARLLSGAAETLAKEFGLALAVAEGIVARANQHSSFQTLLDGDPAAARGPSCRLEVNTAGIGRFVTADRVVTALETFRSRWIDVGNSTAEADQLLSDLEAFLETEPDCVPAWYQVSEMRAVLGEIDMGQPALRTAVALQMRMARLAQPRLKSLPFQDNQRFYQAARELLLEMASRQEELREAADLAAGLLIFDEYDHIGARYLATVIRSALDDHGIARELCQRHLDAGASTGDGLALLARGLVMLNASSGDADMAPARAALIEAAMLLPGLHGLVVDGVISGSRGRGSRRPAPELYDAEELLTVFDTYQPEAMLSLRQLYGQEEIEELITEIELPGAERQNLTDIRLVAFGLAQQPLAMVTPESGDSVRPNW